MQDKIEGYAFFILFLNLSFALLNVAGLGFMHTEILGLDVADSITTNVQEITTSFENASSGFEYVVFMSLLIYNGIKIILGFVGLVLIGMKPVFQAFGISPLIYVPVIAVIDALIVYSLGKMMTRIG